MYRNNAIILGYTNTFSRTHDKIINAELLRHFMDSEKNEPITWGLPKWGRTEAVFQLLFFNFALYPA
jgi:hypothetical protein